MNYYENETTTLSSYWDRRNALETLANRIPEDDPDKKKARKYGFYEKILNLLADCYDGEGLLNWLANNNFNPFNDFRFADLQFIEDYHAEEGEEEGGQEWQDLKDDCLMVSEDGRAVCVSW